MQNNNFFVVFGPSKSGTTWLQKLLDSHSEIRCHFQLPILHLERSRKYFHKTKVVFNAGRSPFGGVFENEEKERKYFDQLNYFNGILKHLRGLGQGNEELMISTMRGYSKEFLIDEPDRKWYGTKSYTDLDLFFRTFPEGKVINIVRDGRDVCVSKRFHMYRVGAYYHGDEKNKLLYWLNSSGFIRKVFFHLNKKTPFLKESFYNSHETAGKLFNETCLTKFTLDWKYITQYILEWKKKKPNQSLIVKYENLKKDPEKEIIKILDFLEVDKTEKQIGGMLQATDFKKLKAKDDKGFFRKGSIGDWEHHFNDADKKLFKKLSGNLLVELGYVNSENW